MYNVKKSEKNMGTNGLPLGCVASSLGLSSGIVGFCVDVLVVLPPWKEDKEHIIRHVYILMIV